MEEPIIYVIKGDPIALRRACPGKKGMYDSQKELKLVMGITIASQHDNRPFYKGPLEMTIRFFMRINCQAKKKPVPKYHIFTPDVSNMIKFYEDICTGLLYEDDRLICSTNAVKLYDYDPRVEFSIKELGNEVLPRKL